MWCALAVAAVADPVFLVAVGWFCHIQWSLRGKPKSLDTVLRQKVSRKLSLLESWHPIARMLQTLSLHQSVNGFVCFPSVSFYYKNLQGKIWHIAKLDWSPPVYQYSRKSLSQPWALILIRVLLIQTNCLPCRQWKKSGVTIYWKRARKLRASLQSKLRITAESLPCAGIYNGLGIRKVVV